MKDLFYLKVVPLKEILKVKGINNTKMKVNILKTDIIATNLKVISKWCFRNKEKNLTDTWTMNIEEP